MINYGIIHDAIAFYESEGFTRVEVPWTVTKEISDITKPPEKRDFQLVHEDGKVLVASAEQSFLYQYCKGFLPKGRFVSCTPCFRGDPHDSLHKKYFIKVELMQTDAVSGEELQAVVDCAMRFFRRFLPEDGLGVVETGTHAFDINFRGVELGSYGIRSCDFLTWIYGTGVAEPRLSSIIAKAQREGSEPSK